jgi:hypothetical protein
LLASWRLVLWRPRDDRHDVDAVAGEDRDVRVVLEETGGGGDIGGFDDQKARDLVLRIGDARLVTRLVLPTMTSVATMAAALRLPHSSHAFRPAWSIASGSDLGRLRKAARSCGFIV